MNIVKASFLNFCSLVVKIAAGLATTKIIAIYTGPAGVAIIGQMTNAMNLLVPFSNGGIGNGVVKYLSEYQSLEHDGKIRRLINTTLSVTLLTSAVIAVLIGLFSNRVSVYLFGDLSYGWIFVTVALSLPVIALGHTLLCMINGFKRIKAFAAIGALNSILSVVLAYFLTIPLGLKGALISIVVTHISLFFLSSYFIMATDKPVRGRIKLHIDCETIKKLSKFGFMGLVSAAVVPISHIAIRTFIMKSFSVAQAGHWQGMWRISDTYLSAILLPLSIYYLPRLSGIQQIDELKKEISITFVFSISLALILSVIVYIFRDWIIALLFTDDFREMKILFPFQLMGNVVKVGAWSIGMLMWAKSMTRLFIVTEVFFSSSFVLFSIYFLNTYAMIGVTYAYLLNQIIYFCFLVLYFRKKIHSVI